MQASLPEVKWAEGSAAHLDRCIVLFCPKFPQKRNRGVPSLSSGPAHLGHRRPDYRDSRSRRRRSPADEAAPWASVQPPLEALLHPPAAAFFFRDSGTSLRPLAPHVWFRFRLFLIRRLCSPACFGGMVYRTSRSRIYNHHSKIRSIRFPCC